MNLLGKNILYDFKQRHADARSQTESLEQEIEESLWKSPHDLLAQFPSARIIGGVNAIFNICHNKYRLWVKIAYNTGVALVKKAGTHKEYDKWNIS